MTEAVTLAAKHVDQITHKDLEQLTYGFAKGYLTYIYIVSATESIERDNPTPVQRRRAHQLRLARKLVIYINRSHSAAVAPVVREFLHSICSEHA